MSASAARAEISALIRSDRQAAERARARVQIEGSEQRGYAASIEIARGSTTGERELRSSRCDELAEAAVLIVAMAIDPEGAAARAAQAAERAPASASSSTTASAEPAREVTAPEKPAQAEPAREAQAAAEREQEDAEEEPEPPESEEEEAVEEDEAEEPSDPAQAGRYVLGVLGSGDAGSLPQSTLGAGLLVGVHWQRVRLELQALAYLPQVEERVPAPMSAVEVSLYTGALSGCFDLLGARDQDRALGACGSLEAGRSSGQPQLISDGRPSAGLWLAGFLGLDVRQRVVGPVHLRLLAEAGVPVLRPSYEIAPFGRVFRASPLLGRFGISAFVLFP